MTSDLGLDLKLSTAKILKKLTEEASSIQDYDQMITKFEEHIINFEEERRKIEVFKRELPFCMFLLNDVIDGLRSELEQCRRRRKYNVLEEFMPIKSKLEDEGSKIKLEKDCKDNKMNWMSSAQLWSDNYINDNNNNNNKNNDTNKTSNKKTEGADESETQLLETKGMSLCGGAFVPFKDMVTVEKDADTASGLPDLSLVSHAVAVVVPEEQRAVSVVAKPIARCHVPASVTGHISLQQQQQQAASRKARRCWSPELHRRFVVALQQLGGAQVATPKQIRELMKVDGLTNDEVKSHLQKYRLHTRKVPNPSSSISRQPVVVIGGLWTNSEQQNYTKSQQSGSPQGPLQLASSSRVVSVTNGDSCDDDGKSESYTWK